MIVYLPTAMVYCLLMQLLPDVSMSKPNTVSPSGQRDGGPRETGSEREGWGGGVWTNSVCKKLPFCPVL